MCQEEVGIQYTHDITLISTCVHLMFHMVLYWRLPCVFPGCFYSLPCRLSGLRLRLIFKVLWTRVVFQKAVLNLLLIVNGTHSPAGWRAARATARWRAHEGANPEDGEPGAHGLWQLHMCCIQPVGHYQPHLYPWGHRYGRRLQGFLGTNPWIVSDICLCRWQISCYGVVSVQCFCIV